MSVIISNSHRKLEVKYDNLKRKIPNWTNNASIDYYRKSIRRRTEDIEQAFHVSSTDADVVSQCTEKEILAAVQLLSPAYRTVFNLYVIEGYSHKEIAGQLDITESTSRSNLVKARIKLKDLLAVKQIGHGE